MAENIIDIVYDRIKFDKDKLETGELQRIEVDSFNLSDFWSQFGAAVQALSNEVTKIGFMCGKTPYPSAEEMSSLMQEMLQYYTVTRDLYLVLPLEVGAEVFKAVTSAMLAIMASLLDVVHSLNELTEKGAKERLMLTGAFWETCNAVESLPRNNLTAVMKAVYAEAELAKDALDELTATIEEDREVMSETVAVDVDSDEMWTNPERDFATNSVGLVKVTHLCLMRVHKALTAHGSCDTSTHSAQLDKVTGCVREASPALDDFVSELYHPIDFTTAIANAGRLVSVLRQLLFSVQGSHLEPGLDKHTANQLLQFIGHNHSKLDPSVSDTVQLPEINNLSINV